MVLHGVWGGSGGEPRSKFGGGERNGTEGLQGNMTAKSQTQGVERPTLRSA